MKEGYIKQEDRKKILLLTDDIRVHSGVAQIGREMVLNTCHRYNWVQMAGAVKHPDSGKIIDHSEPTNNAAGIDDSYVKLYPTDGYGTPDQLREIIKREKPDALFLITDPRYFIWLFQIENEIRQDIPIAYLNIWDDLPAPQYNEEFYESCDALFGISKQTVLINEVVLGDKAEHKIVRYVPHGLNNNIFKPIEPSKEFNEFKKQLTRNQEKDFILFFNSRNIRRKSIPDALVAWKLFTDKLTPEQKAKCLFVLHTEISSDHGTDLGAVIEYLFGEDDQSVVISNSKLPPEQMNFLYNCADGVILLSAAEGWGLSLTEALLTGTPIIANVTGGMQDQMRFVDENGKWYTNNLDVPSNHKETYTECGEWALPVFPQALSLVGSPVTPYIWDDRCKAEDAAERIFELYSMGSEKRKEIGEKGREWALSDEAGFTSEKMADRIIEGMDALFSTWKPRPKFLFYKDTDYTPRVLRHKLEY